MSTSPDVDSFVCALRRKDRGNQQFDRVGVVQRASRIGIGFLQRADDLCCTGFLLFVGFFHKCRCVCWPLRRRIDLMEAFCCGQTHTTHSLPRSALLENETIPIERRLITKLQHVLLTLSIMRALQSRTAIKTNCVDHGHGTLPVSLTGKIA
jgi:hypothetical protein